MRLGSLHVAPVIIKPDMSPHERKIESLQLKERWSLIQSRESIKIRGHRLFIRNKLHGQVTMFGSDISFCRHTSCSIAENSTDHNVQPIVSAPPLSTASLSQSHPHTSVVTSPATLNDTRFVPPSVKTIPPHPRLILILMLLSHLPPQSLIND